MGDMQITAVINGVRKYGLIVWECLGWLAIIAGDTKEECMDNFRTYSNMVHVNKLTVSWGWDDPVKLEDML